jgi:ABC-type phosphate/phosphonate transport system ATPase subunit
LGIDEISLVKEQGSFIVIVGDLGTGKLVGLVSETKARNLENLLIFIKFIL